MPEPRDEMADSRDENGGYLFPELRREAVVVEAEAPVALALIPIGGA